MQSDTRHYANTPMQYTAIFHGCKNVNFQMKNFNTFLTFAQNIDCGYTLEPPQRGGSNEYPQSMFWSKNKKKKTCKPQFYCIKVGCKGVFVTRTCFRDARNTCSLKASSVCGNDRKSPLAENQRFSRREYFSSV